MVRCFSNMEPPEALNSNALLHEGIESEQPRGSLSREADPKSNTALEAVRGGLSYAKMHTANFGSVEIRFQVRGEDEY